MAYRLGNNILKVNNKLFYTSGLNPVWNGLQSYWRLNETSGTNAADAIGSFAGTLTTGSFNANGKRGYCYYNTVDGSKAITCGTSTYNYSQSQPVTFNIWAKRSGSGVFDTFFSKQIAGSPFTANFHFRFHSANYVDYFLIYQFSPSVIALGRYTSETITDTNWHMFTGTYDGSSIATGINIYFDGALKTMNNYGWSMSGAGTISTNGNFSIGGVESAGQAFNGYLDEAAIWNRVLTPTEIATLYNSGTGLFY